MNPCSPAPKSKKSLFDGSIDWESFEKWVFRDHRETTAREIISYAKKYAHCLLNKDLQPLVDMRKTKRAHVMKALSNLAKFLGMYEDYRKLIRSYGFSWKGKSSDELIIDRLTKVKDPNEVFNWIREVKRRCPELCNFMDLMAVSGLRLIEAVECYNLIISLSRQGRLHEYYNEENRTLEHFRFKEKFIRKTKKAFISFIPKDLVERIALSEEMPSRYMIQKIVEKAGLKGRFSDVREAHATFMIKYLRQPEIDFLHGRVSTNIFMSNYFNPALISDLRERVFKGIKEIQTLIS